MLAFKNWLTNTLVNDATLQTYLKDANNMTHVYPMDIDIQPELFPAITYGDAGVSILSVPKGMHVGIIQLDIWSITNALETENIYERVAQLLNFKDSTTQTITGTLWWIREMSSRDMHSAERRIWRKVVDLKFWVSKTDFT